ncbi:MAG TPA: DUF92 domain-containing protein [Gemmatimonadaceae bacterium]|nr:DUF92 domain-containing protein [Gemmatimonadaceae bacterium]
MDEIFPRMVVGFILAAAIAYGARRARTLSTSGALAAAAVGTTCVAAGWSWSIVLIAMFLTATTLTRVGGRRKAARVEDADGGESDGRTAVQVLANGALYTFAALISLTTSSLVPFVIGAGAIAAATADTWATEIGTLSEKSPRSILTGKPVATGESGGVTFLGWLGAAGGAGAIAGTALAVGWPIAAGCAALIGGIGGATVDSLLGATLQSRRWCDRCGKETERRVHRCGTTTEYLRGISWMDNNAVNALSSLGGGILGMLCLI